MSISPENILKLGTGFWASRTLLSAVELNLFTELARNPGDAVDLQKRIGLHPRAARDFLDALTALGFLRRENGTYHNTPETGQFLNEDNPAYIGEFLRMLGQQNYLSWTGLTQALRMGKKQSEGNGEKKNDVYTGIYNDQAKLKVFLGAMTALSVRANGMIAERLPWKDYQSFVDVGAAEGGLVVAVAKRHPHLSGIGFDLPPVRPVFEDYVERNLPERNIRFVEGDFFERSLPEADVVVMAHVLHNWNTEQKNHLLRSAYAALPQGGMLVVYDAIIDDARHQNTFGLLMSLNMLVETSGGSGYTGADCRGWMAAVGFRDIRQEHLAGAESMMIGFKR